MKFLIVLSVLVVCATAKPFFLKHKLLSGLLGGGGLGGSSSSAGSSSDSSFVPAPAPPAPVYTPEPAAPAANPLAGIHKILMIPINIKKSLLQAHQAKFNKKIQGLFGLISGLGGSGGGGSHGESNGNSISGPEPAPFIPETPTPYVPETPAPAPIGGLSGGNVDYNSLGGGESSYSNSGSQSFSSGSGLSTGGNVETFHPQPAPNTNYQSPIVLYLYPVNQGSSQASAGSSSVNYQPGPSPQPDCNHPAPFVPQPQPAPFVPQPQPAPFVPEIQPAPFIPEPVAPQQTYGPPDFVPSPPISSSISSGTASSSSFDYEPQQIQQISQPPNTYLPPSYKRRY